MHTFARGLVTTCIVVLYAAVASAAADPVVTCEASKLKIIGKYASCRLAAESKAVKTAGPVDYGNCSLDKFTDAETKAEGACPTTGDALPIADFMDSCTTGAAAAVAPGGNTDGLDPLTCATDLAACESDCVASVRPPMSSGQTTCYDGSGSVIACAGSGQDGESLKGAAHSFTDNGNGTVTDNTTGLMWEKLSDDGTIHDKDTAYNWSDAFAVKVATLNSGNFAGHNDWRVPNRPELETIVNLGAVNPATFAAFDTACVPSCTVTACSCTQSNFYWSSTTYQHNPSYAWTVYFLDGYTTANYKTLSSFVRAVRAGS